MPPAAADLRDIKALAEFPHGTPWWAVGSGLALFALASLAVWWWWRVRRARSRGAAAGPPPEPPDVVALAALAALRRELGTTADAAAIQRYFYGLSGAARTYVEARYGLNATDLTTSEIRWRLERARGLPPALGGELVDLLEVADAVKFARSPATLADCDGVLGRARAFVEATRRPELTAAETPAAREAAQ